MSERLLALVYPETKAVDELLVAGPVARISRDDAQSLAYRQAEVGARLGPQSATFWFRGAALVPATWGGGRVDLLWDSASEATLWLDGFAAEGLNPQHRDALLVERGEPSESVFFEIELACNGPSYRDDDAGLLPSSAVANSASSTATPGSSTSTSRRCAYSRGNTSAASTRPGRAISFPS